MRNGFYKTVKYEALEDTLKHLDISQLPNIIKIMENCGGPQLAGLIVEFGDLNKAHLKKRKAIRKKMRSFFEFMSNEYTLSQAWYPIGSDESGDYNHVRYYTRMEKRNR